MDHLDHSKEKSKKQTIKFKRKPKGNYQKMQTNWTYDNVSKSFYNTANEFLQKR
jgi:hypothetical protein